MTHSCSSLHYTITSEDCGDCPSIANTTTVDCSIKQLQLTDVVLCRFSVQAVICETVVGESSNTSTFLLKGIYTHIIVITN